MAKKGRIQKEAQFLQSQVEELENRWKRALADYQNLEKRYEREKHDFIQFANSALILKLLGVLNHLEKAARNLKDKGLDLVVGEFRRILTDEGVEEIKCLGERFDPQLMEAVEVVQGGEDDKVAGVINKGYFLKGKLLLPARVKVYKSKSEENRL